MEPLSSDDTVKRTQRHRSVTMVVVAGVVGAIVFGGTVGLRSLANAGSRLAGESTPPTTTHMHNGLIGVSGWMNGVRSLTPDGMGAYIFECSGRCSHVVADWSSDGTRLAFTTGCGPNCSAAGSPYNGLHVVDLASGSDRLIVPSVWLGDLAWSPDGRRIAYEMSLSRGSTQQIFRIFVMDEDGSARRRVAAPTSWVDSLSWSPDGSRIAYSDGDRLFVLSLDGSTPSDLGVNARSPAWSPDGTKIAYFSGDSACEVRETTPDGTNDLSLVDLSAISARCDYGGDLEWSPDGTELAAEVFQELHPRKGRTAVYIIRSDGSSTISFTGWIQGWPWDGLAWQPIP